jgi:hypothetical protein
VGSEIALLWRMSIVACRRPADHWNTLFEARVVIGDFKHEHNRRHRFLGLAGLLRDDDAPRQGDHDRAQGESSCDAMQVPPQRGSITSRRIRITCEKPTYYR